jgi:protease IV
MTEWLPGTPGTAGGAVGGFLNPAVWSTLEGSLQESAIWWNDRSLRRRALDNWGFALSGPVGFGANSQVFALDGETYRVTDWQVGVSVGDRGRRAGLAYRWPTGDVRELGWQKTLVAGWLLRPSPYLSLGAVGVKSVESSSRQGMLDLGLRPFGGDRIVLHGDFTLSHRERLEDGRWGAGVTIQPVRGIHLGLSARDVPGGDDLRWIARVGVTGERLGLDWLGGKTGGGDLDRSSFLVRFDPAAHRVGPVPGLTVTSSTYYAPVNLENRYLTYQKYRYFDAQRVAWLDLLTYLDAAAADPRCAGLVLNLSDFRGRASLVWELRRRLEAMQADGKEIIALVGRLDMLGYYLASVADHLIMEPEGSLLLPGIASGRTYFQGMVEKLGLGYQELRHFTHKSAAEGGSRMDMSEAEREQRDRLVEVIYDGDPPRRLRGARPDRGRVRRPGRRGVYLNPSRALELGLIDARAAARTCSAGWAATAPGAAGALSRLPPGRPAGTAVGPARPHRRGLRGRRVRAGHGHQGPADLPLPAPAGAATATVAAVVLRVDSPGGDPLPSEMVAAAVRRLREAGIPVIVSQGDVAASGGYWLSMDGQEVLTTPLTVTGSIGVISAWVWAKELALTAGPGLRRGPARPPRRPAAHPRDPAGGHPRAAPGARRTGAGALPPDDPRGLRRFRGPRRGGPRPERGPRAASWARGGSGWARTPSRAGSATAWAASARRSPWRAEAAGIRADREVELVEYPPRRGSICRRCSAAARCRCRSRSAPRRDAAAWAELAALDAARPGGGRRTLRRPSITPSGTCATVSRDMGRPQAVLPPEVLPAGWGEPD